MGKAFPWREALFINGIFSGVLGVVALILVRLYAADIHEWLREQPPEKVQAVGELAVLCYLAYAVGMLVVSLAGFVLTAWFPRKQTPKGTLKAAGTENDPTRPPV